MGAFDFGARQEGEATDNTVSNLYARSTYRDCTIHAYTDVPICIVVPHLDRGSVFNCQTQALTEDIFSQLTQFH